MEFFYFTSHSSNNWKYISGKVISITSHYYINLFYLILKLNKTSWRSTNNNKWTGLRNGKVSCRFFQLDHVIVLLSHLINMKRFKGLILVGMLGWEGPLNTYNMLHFFVVFDWTYQFPNTMHLCICILKFLHLKVLEYFVENQWAERDKTLSCLLSSKIYLY